jgi:hypothetical protein
VTAAELRRCATLERIAFKTSRLAEFCGQRELVAQTGHSIEDWPLVILKELVDNALDACEEAEVPPQIDIKVSTETGEITVADSGPGLPPETIADVLDYTVRISSREPYVSPSRGQQGNALKCIIAMPFALDGKRGCTVVEARGQAHRILFEMDPVRRGPRIGREVGPSDVQNGSRITLCWPRSACPLLVGAKARFVQTAQSFTTFNPHLSLRGRWDEWEFADVLATNPGWRKWRACDPTSAHWYDPERFERYIAAHVARDEDHRRNGRTVRDFIKELDGLSRSGKQKLVLAETKTSGVALASFFEGGQAAVTRLLSACQGHTKPVKPDHLGLIGTDHLREDCCQLGADRESFEYRKHLGVTRAGLPYAIEAAFAYCPDEDRGRQLISGVNFSVGIGSPFERINLWHGLTAILERLHANYRDPVVVVLHYTCPRVEFLDRGKGTLALPSEVGLEITRLVEAVTKGWDKQKRAEIRHADAEANRIQRLLKVRLRPEKEAPSEPTGRLAEKISTEAAEAGLSIDELTVLSRNNDPYTAWRRRREGEWFARLFDRFVATDATKHLRGLFYLLVSTTATTAPNGKSFVNDYKNWQLLQKASKAARWLGLIPFARIIDERNAPPEIHVPAAAVISTGVNTGERCETPASANAAMPGIYIDGFRARQTHRIILYGEKSSLSAVLRPIAEAIGAEMILVTGESSDRYIWEMADRASQDGRPAVVLYFADFDPSGHQMAISVARKIQALRDFQYPGLNIKLYRVALTIDQVRALDLPSSPLKHTERRADRWRAKHGHDQTEIDAMVELHPEALRQATLEAVAPFYDDTLDNRARQVEEAWRKQAGEALRRHSDYRDFSRRIEGAYERAQDAVAELHNEQERASEILQETLPRPPKLPGAARSGAAKPALFDSDTDFVTASLRLIADKQLDDDDEGRAS